MKLIHVIFFLALILVIAGCGNQKTTTPLTVARATDSMTQEEKTAFIGNCQNTICFNDNSLGIDVNETKIYYYVVKNDKDCDLDVSLKIGGVDPDSENVYNVEERDCYTETGYCGDLLFITFSRIQLEAKGSKLVPFEVRAADTAKDLYRYKFDFNLTCNNEIEEFSKSILVTVGWPG